MKRMQRVFGDLDALRYVDGRLDAERRAAFVAHLADEPAEAERVALWSRQTETLRAAFAGVALEPIPPALRLGNVLPARPLNDDPRAPIALRSFPPRPAPADVPAVAALPRSRALRRDLRLPLSAAVLFGLALLIVYVSHGLLASTTWAETPVPTRPIGPQAELASRAADAFTTFAIDSVRPVEFGAAQVGQLATWTRRRLGIALTPADLSAEGWTLLGGRLVPAGDAPGAFFIYEDRGGDRLGLLVSRAPLAGTSTPTLAPAGLSAATMSWSAGSLGYVIAAGKSIDWLSRNGEALREHIGPAG